jgi:hypothetical protein
LNILYLSQLLPYPLDAGAKLREYYVLRYLAERHSVTLAAFVRGSDTPEAQGHLRALVTRLVTCPIQRSAWREAWAVARSALSGEPVLIARDRNSAMFAQLRRLTAETQFDAIHADQLWMAPYALAAEVRRGAGSRRPRLVLDQHNAVYLIPRRLAHSAKNPAMRLAWRREARQMARYEAAICRAVDRVVTVTAADQAALAERSASAGVLFVGGMHWPPNADGAAWFAESILPAVREKAPLARFLAVGRQPPESLRQPAADFIEAPGYVDDPGPYWARSQVFVVPLRAGGGMRVKILDAWAQGLPVVSTTIGAEGLIYQEGENILIADTPEAFAAAVVSVLNDAGLAQRLASAGRANVEQHYDWRRAYPAWDAIYASG